MTDPRTFRLERHIREATAFHAKCDPPDPEVYRRLMAELDDARDGLPRADALRLESLIERLTGFNGRA